MNRLEKCLAIAKEVSKKLGLANGCEVYFVTSEKRLEEIKPTMTDAAWEAVQNPKVKGYATPHKKAYIFLYRISGIAKSIDDELVITHELRHLWQYQTGFAFSSHIIPYEWRAQERDANEYALKSSKKLKTVNVVSNVIQWAVITGVGMLMYNKFSSK